MSWKTTIRVYNEEASLLCESHSDEDGAKEMVAFVMEKYPEATTIHVYFEKGQDHGEDAHR